MEIHISTCVILIVGIIVAYEVKFSLPCTRRQAKVYKYTKYKKKKLPVKVAARHYSFCTIHAFAGSLYQRSTSDFFPELTRIPHKTTHTKCSWLSYRLSDINIICCCKVLSYAILQRFLRTIVNKVVDGDLARLPYYCYIFSSTRPAFVGDLYLEWIALSYRLSGIPLNTLSTILVL